MFQNPSNQHPGFENTNNNNNNNNNNHNKKKPSSRLNGQHHTQNSSRINQRRLFFNSTISEIPQSQHSSTSPSSSNTSDLTDTNPDNIELFLRYRSETYLKNSDYSTALFFAERLLSEKDNLFNRLLVAKCYKELNKYNAAYHILSSETRKEQMKYQRNLQHKSNQTDNNSLLLPFGALHDHTINNLNSTTNDTKSVIKNIGFNFNNSTFNHNDTHHHDMHHENNKKRVSFGKKLQNKMLYEQSKLSTATPNSFFAAIPTDTSNNNNSTSETTSFLQQQQQQQPINDISPVTFLENKPNTSRSGSFINDNNKHPVFNLGSTTTNDVHKMEEDRSILYESRYFIALICFELSRYDECEEFLLGKKHSDSVHIALTIPNGVYGIYLLGKVFHKSNRPELAVKYYNKCLQIDSYHIGAIHALCELGKDPGLISTKQSNNEDNHKILLAHHALIPLHNELKRLDQLDIVSFDEIQSLFTNLIWGYYKLEQYSAKESLEYFSKLSASHTQSAWVLHNTARCYFEMNDYSRAVVNWKKQCDIYPYNMMGMDYYSTSLWHLRCCKELTLLTQHCSEIDRTSPEYYMVMGNCFSLNKSHDLAIKYFRRATSIDPNYYYAYTLCGHEYVVNEDFDSALQSFESALRLNIRHYNAWYGIGNIYQYQQNYKQALHHFQQAIRINPNSSVLYCCIGNIYLLQQNNYKLALSYINRAIKLSLTNGQINISAKFDKANIYLQMNEYSAAIKEFNELLQIIPNEWKIHFHLAEIYNKCGQKNKALLSYNKAMTLNPKDKNIIKHALQNIYNQETTTTTTTKVTKQPQQRRTDMDDQKYNFKRIATNQDEEDDDDDDMLDEQEREERVDEDDDDDDGESIDDNNNNDEDDDDDDDDLVEQEHDDDDDEYMNPSNRASIDATAPSHSLSPPQ